MPYTEFDVYSKNGCPYCVRAINLLKMKGKSYREIKLDVDIDRDTLLETIQYYGHGNTMPMIIHHDNDGNVQRIGGYTELEKFFREGDK